MTIDTCHLSMSQQRISFTKMTKVENRATSINRSILIQCTRALVVLIETRATNGEEEEQIDKSLQTADSGTWRTLVSIHDLVPIRTRSTKSTQAHEDFHLHNERVLRSFSLVGGCRGDKNMSTGSSIKSMFLPASFPSVYVLRAEKPKRQNHKNLNWIRIRYKQ